MNRTSLFAAALLGFCTACVASAEDSIPSATPEQVHQTVARAIGYLQTESSTWFTQRVCFSCHHAAMPLWALSVADQRGYAIDKKYLLDSVESMVGGPEKLISSKMFSDPADPPDTRPLAAGVKIGTAFMAVAARSLPSLTDGQQQALQIIADKIVEKQRPDGSWEFFLSRPPINENELTDGVWIAMALQAGTGPDASEAQRAAVAKALQWLAGAKPSESLQDKVLLLLLAARTGKTRAEMQPAIDALFAQQQTDGAWRQRPDLPTDAFATGQALYALALAGCTLDRPEMKRGVDWLVARQSADGTWPMASRSSPDGSPGSSKLLSPILCGAAGWATLALATLVPLGS